VGREVTVCADDIVSREHFMRNDHPTVFVVIPVFNRLQFTKECLDSLRAQTYAPLRLIVVDGGSTDGTRASLEKNYPEVVVLGDKDELWWGGAMQRGIEYSLQNGRSKEDMLLMMNNDTYVEPNYVDILVRVSQHKNAAVGALVVDSCNPNRILDAGEFIDWSTYRFSVKTTIENGEFFFDRVDMLPGRGTLVPMHMIEQSGNINALLFPHYIADYEFFCRLKRQGFRLGVTYEARVQSRVDATGLFAGESASLTFCQAWKVLFSTGSMHNVRDHWRFIDQCAPSHLRSNLKGRLLWDSTYLALSRTKLRHVVLPLSWFVAGLYYVTKNDCDRCGLNVTELVRENILRPWTKEGWYVFSAPREKLWRERRELRPLYARSRNPLTKVSRWLRAKAYRRLMDHRLSPDHSSPDN
jgi:glycosyltransferase involved in cell wall biosynthesis